MKFLLHQVVFLLCFGRFVNGQDSGDPQFPIPSQYHWLEEGFAKNKVPPFSFVYGGKNSDTFITKWEYSVSVKESKNPDAVEKVYTYRDKKSRLEVDCYVTYFKDFPAIEWMLKFSNRSDRNTPVLEQVAVADHSFSYKKKTVHLFFIMQKGVILNVVIFSLMMTQ